MDRKDIIQFEKDYSGIPVYPGLGNHDYQNYIDDKWCDGWYIEAGGYRAWAQNLCAARLVEWFVGRVKTIPASKNDIKVSGHRGKDISGSLAYSFDKYDWHFVQLNNKPGYTKRFTSYDSWIVRQRNIDIKDSYLWLKNDLNKNKNKNTVLNYHIFNNDNEMGTILDDNPQVVAIFAGHYHNMIGSGYLNNGNYYNYHNSRYYIRTPKGRIIPVFYSGSAENNIYLHATFKPKSLTVKPVSSVNGNYKYIGKENIINF
ncbi:Alr1329 protein [Moritella viscosa]|uniref:Alr1329 protein n=2 Tax=Moritella viscosa TaxID=80854 RepID=A0A1L0AFZ8_9GAMM|nr:metallophosphoesterase [Moritella viscosa]SGY85944.1 Alr1329 protein [Moritella viscosa]